MANLRSAAVALTALLIFGATSAEARKRDGGDVPRKSQLAVSGYSGGMMVHSGFLSSSTVSFSTPDGSALGLGGMRIKGIPIGIGGALKVHFGKHFRVGTEGYSSNLKYGKHGSYEHIGWGGLLVDGVIPVGRWFPFAGVTVGGGGVKNVTVLQNTTGDFMLDDGTTSYRRYAFMAVSPFTGVEFALTERVHLVIKADWLLDVTSGQKDFADGPRIYAGFMFCH